MRSMKLKKGKAIATRALISSVAMSLSMGLAACSDNDESDDPAGKSGPERRIDTSEFKNTESAEGFRDKADNASDYFGSFDGLRAAFASGAGNGLMDLADMDEPQDPDFPEAPDFPDFPGNPGDSDTPGDMDDPADPGNQPGDTPDGETQVGGGEYVPDFQNLSNCGEAFDEFEKLYAQLETEYAHLLSMLENPTQFALADGPATSQGGQLLEAETDDKSAVSYAIASPEGAEGIKMKGFIKGGADGDLVLLRQSYDVEMDFSKMGSMPMSGTPSPEGAEAESLIMKNAQTQSFAIDSKARLIEMVADMSMVLSAGEGRMATTMKGRIALSDGTEKFIEQDMHMLLEADGQKQAMAVRAAARLVDDSTISYDAKVESDEGKGIFSFKLVRDDLGQCKVVDFVNSVP